MYIWWMLFPICSPSIHFLNSFFDEQTFWHFWSVIWPFKKMVCTWALPKKSLPTAMAKVFSYVFLQKLYILGFICVYDPSQIYFLCMKWEGRKDHFPLCRLFSCSSTILKRLSFPYLIDLVSCSKTDLSFMCGSISELSTQIHWHICLSS